jgi:hypothetical protein
MSIHVHCEYSLIFSYVRYITYFINYWLHVDALRLKPSFNLPVTMIHIKYCWNMQVLAVNLCEQDLGVKAVVVKPKWWGGHSFFFRIGGGAIHFFGGLVGGSYFFLGMWWGGHSCIFDFAKI